MHDTQVLIVGAGPVGLTMAAFLTHYGIRCRIIDQDAHQTLTSNAVCVHARTLELFEEIGLTQSLLKQGTHIRGANFFLSQKLMGQINFSYIASQYALVSDTPQSMTEKILIDYLQQQNILVERNTCFTSMQSSEEGIVAQLMCNGVQKNISADWLIACDGYKSTVRQFLEIPYEGSEFQYKFLMIDAPIRGLPDYERGYFASDQGLSFFIFPMPQSVRCIVEVSHSPEFINAEATQETFAAIAKKCLPLEISIDSPLWASKFYVHEKRAGYYQKDRVFLAGDAAHVHIPAAGQGMNTGMQDAINLSWKLALVLKNQAGQALLASYQQERIPIANQVLAMTTHMAQMMFPQNKWLVKMRNLFVHYMSRRAWVQKFMTNTIAELKVQYKDSALNMGGNFHGLRPGMRAPLVPIDVLHGKHLILDFSSDMKQVFAEWAYVDLATVFTVPLDNQTLRAAYAGMRSGYCIIRPDRYISYIGDDFQMVINYFKRLI